MMSSSYGTDTTGTGGAFFPKPARRSLTWFSAANRKGYALDHALVRSRDACMVIDVDPTTLPECYSEHRCLVAKLNQRRGLGGHVRRGLRAARHAGADARHDVAKLNETAATAFAASAVTAAVDGAPRAADTSALDGAEQALAAALRAAADDVLGRANCTRRRLGWQAEHACTMKEKAAARRQLAARHDLSANERKEARRQQCSDALWPADGASDSTCFTAAAGFPARVQSKQRSGRRGSAKRRRAA